MLADCVRAARLINAERADGTVVLGHDVASDPADVLGHLLVADASGALACRAEISDGWPAITAPNRVQVHVVSFSLMESPLPDESGCLAGARSVWLSARLDNREPTLNFR